MRFVHILGGTEVPVSLTEALRAGAPQAFGALYDEYAGALYAYCRVMVGDEAGDALRDAFSTVARHPGAIPGDDAELPVWLHSLARSECVRRGALVRGVVTTGSADPLRRALALLTPEDREVLALSNALDPEQTAQVLGVARDAAETLVPEAQQRLEQAAASVGGRETPDSAMLASLSGEALRRLVTLGHEPPVGQREWVLSDDATHQFAKISPDEPPTEPLRPVGGISAGAPPGQSGESASPEPGFAEAATLGFGAVGWESRGAGPAGEPANTGEQPPFARGTHAKRRKPALGRRLLPVVVLVACAAAAAGTALAWPSSHHANETSSLVHQSARPSRSAQPTPSGDQASSPSWTTTSTPNASPTPSGTAPADGPGSAEPAPTADPTTPLVSPTAKPKPRHTATPGNGHRTTGPRGPGRTCHGFPGRAPRCVRPHPWHPHW
jgi:DNA-directed RNA polymerase specialized sigma24 family protein